MSNNINVTEGVGKTVATEDVGGSQYQKIELYGPGGSSVATINPDGSQNVSIVGIVRVYGSVVSSASPASISGAVNISGSVMLGSSNASVIAVLQSSSLIAVASGNQSVSGAVTVAGSVLLGSSNASVIAVIQGSIAAVVTPSANQSISGAINISGSVLLGSSNSSVIALIQGSVAAAQIGTQITSIVNSIPSSVLVGASIFGQLPAGTAVLGSVAALQGTNPWIVTGSVSGALNISGSVLLGSSNASVIAYLQSSSIIGVVTGSVVTVFSNNSVLSIPTSSTIAIIQANSIVGSYAEDAAHTTGDKGLFVMQVRNDTMSSITSADGDYSPIAGGPIGETITANAPLTKWVQGTADLRGAGTLGGSVIAIAAGGSSIFTYITGVQVLNMGSASVLVTLASGGSTLGYTIAPAGGGSNIVYPNALKTPANFGFAASLSGVASVIVSAQGFIAKI